MLRLLLEFVWTKIMVKDTLNSLVENGALKAVELNGKNDRELVNILFNMLPVSALAELKSKVFDNDFVLIMRDADLIQSVDSLFENNLNLSETSKKTFLHRNTLLYRLNKIQSATGYDLRNFSDAMSFKLLMLIYYRFN